MTDELQNQESELHREAPALEPQRRRAVRRLLRAETIYAAMLIVFAVLASFAYVYRYFSWDLATARWLQSLPLPGLYPFMRSVSLFGDKWTPWALAILAFIAFMIFHLRSEAFALALSAGGGQTLNSLIKILIARPRPARDLVNVYRDMVTLSFPSGHVTFYVCFFGFLFFVAYALLPAGSLARRVTLTLTALPVLLIGLSRIYLGAHWPSDTLGAYLLSSVWLAFSLHMYRIWKERATFHRNEGKNVS